MHKSKISIRVIEQTFVIYQAYTHDTKRSKFRNLKGPSVFSSHALHYELCM
jgi:hypothetical protein